MQTHTGHIRIVNLTIVFLVKIAGSFLFGAVVYGTCIYICEAFRDCFTFISMLKASTNSRQVSENFCPPSFGKECKRCNAVEMLL